MSTETDSYLESLGIEVGGELSQHGVKGMRWGVRKAQERSAKRTAKAESVDSARKRVVARREKIYSAKGEYKKAKREDKQVRNQARAVKNGKEFAAFFFGGQVALRAVQKRSVAGSGADQSPRQSAIDAARAKQAATSQAKIDAKTTLKDLRAAQESDWQIAKRSRDGKEFARNLLAGPSYNWAYND